VELYRRNYLELLRIGKQPAEAYYLSRVIGLADEREFRHAVEGVRQTGYPKGRLPYTVERAAIQIRDLPGGMILILLTFFASLFAFVWAASLWDKGVSAGAIFFVTLGLVAAGLHADLRDFHHHIHKIHQQITPAREFPEINGRLTNRGLMRAPVFFIVPRGDQQASASMT